jgi:glyoxylase-like metal-dependent hydrolase (beta-lactamase superfamily II)
MLLTPTENAMKLRASFRGLAAAFAATISAALLCGGLAQASAPQQKTQAPGYYRIMLGDFEVTALNDGTVKMDTGKILKDVKPEHLQKALAHAFLKDPFEWSFNGFLINTGPKLVLVDTGAGTFFGPTLGKLVANLKASGYKPEQVDEIYITHMHSDHIGGLVADGTRVFANAVVRAAQQEGDYWLSQAHMDAAPEDRKDSFKSAMSAINPYVVAGKYKPFIGDMELIPGIRAMGAAGHTPGHTVYVVESKGEKLLLWGDLMHVASVQFPDPSVTIGFDTDSAAAKEQRAKVFADAAAHGYLVGGAHLPFPALGHLLKSGSGYEFVPTNYTTLP